MKSIEVGPHLNNFLPLPRGVNGDDLEVFVNQSELIV